MVKLALYGLSGSGKSTSTLLIGQICSRRGIACDTVKIAEPLYRLQSHLYGLLGQPAPPGSQDQILLRALATQIRRIAPQFLADDFLHRVGRSTAVVVVNDDLKDTDVDYPRLAAAGFRFLRITCDEATRAGRLAARPDLTQAPETPRTWRFDRITPDWSIDNTADGTDTLTARLSALVAELVA